MGSWCQHICNYANNRVRGSDPLIKILKTGMLLMDPKERLDYLRRIETNLLNNHILDNRVITQTRKIALRDEVADTNDVTTTISGVPQVEKALIFGGNVSPRRVSKIPIQKMASQDKVSGSPQPPSRGLFETNRPQIREILAILVVSLKGNCRKRICRMRLLIAMTPLLP